MGTVGTPLPVVKSKPSPRATTPMKAKRVARAKKVMKTVMKMKKKGSIIAKGKNGKRQVWTSKKVKTAGGLKKEHLIKSKKGKIVSKQRSEKGKQNKWSIATKKAYVVKGYVGFKPIKKGNSFYEKIKEIMAQP